MEIRLIIKYCKGKKAMDRIILWSCCFTEKQSEVE